MSVDKLQEAEEQVAQMREEAERKERETLGEDLRRVPLADTAAKQHRPITASLAQVRSMANMRTGALEDVHELAVSIRETGLLHPPLVRATGEDEPPYELLAGQRRLAAMRLIDEADEPQEWRFTLVDGISRREALSMQFAENFHQSKPEPVMFARAARQIMAEDPALTAAEVSRIVGAPPSWTRKALRLLELPEAIVARVERGDLSFTAADFVRRGIAKGKVSAEDASELVEQHANGGLTGVELKYGVGYVPPPPENYAEVSERLDAARPSRLRRAEAGARRLRATGARVTAVGAGARRPDRRPGRRLRARRVPAPQRHRAHPQAAAHLRPGRRARVRPLPAPARAPARAALVRARGDRGGSRWPRSIAAEIRISAAKKAIWRNRPAP